MKEALTVVTLLISAFFIQAQNYYLHCGQLIDCTDLSVKKEMTIIINGNKIQAVSKGYLPVPGGAQLIDLRNHTVMPGLMDMHVHIESQSGRNSYMNRFTLNEADVAYRAAKYAEINLMAGFTTVRDLGGSGVNIALRNAINQGLVKGPRIFTAGKTISITGGHGDPTSGGKHGLWEAPGPEVGVADGPDECRKAVRQVLKDGADWIKITATGGVTSLTRDGLRPQFQLDEIEAVVTTASDAGIKVAAHAHSDEGARRAVLGGVTSIEHGTFLSEETMDLMKEKGTYYVPTITAGRSVVDSAKIKGFFPDIIVPKALAVGPQIQGTFAKAYKRGVKIAFGTDAAVFAHGRNGMEFIYMVEAGMPAIEAIRAATATNAEMLGVSDRLGSIEAGKLADIVAVPGSPLEDISLMLKVGFVMKDGVVYKSPGAQ